MCADPGRARSRSEATPCTRASGGSRAHSRERGTARAASRACGRCAAPAAAVCPRDFPEEASCAWRLADEIENQQADQHRGQPEEPYLSVGELSDAAEGVPPQSRQEKWEHALDDQHEGERHEEVG